MMWAGTHINDASLVQIKRDARDYALTHGLVLRYAQLSNDNCAAHIPITLFPSPIPRRLYQKCLDIQPIINDLMLKVANDSVFMEDSLKSIVQVDDFTKSLLRINSIVRKEGLAQPIISCINRSDYMLDSYIDSDKNQIRVRQVEMNAIASSMSSHSRNVSSMHNYLMSKYHLSPHNSFTVPENRGLDVVIGGIVDAFDAYGKQDAFVLFVIDDPSPNFSDYIQTELAIQSVRPDIRVIRKKFIDLPVSAKLGPNKELLIDDGKEISLIYFRYCYDPGNYCFGSAWETRLLLEKSRAIKCPSINFHLSGAKKFQQVLKDERQLERFLTPLEASELYQVFCKFWNLDPKSPDGEEGYRLGLQSPENMVLKPQREGGGHNIFGEDIKLFLQQIDRPEDRSQYILMDYINSPQERNCLLAYNDSMDMLRINKFDQLVSELGIYGSVLADGSSTRSSRSGGYLVRSKKFGTKEGGVATGYAGISSVVLLDDKKDDLDLSLFYEL